MRLSDHVAPAQVVNWFTDELLAVEKVLNVDGPAALIVDKRSPTGGCFAVVAGSFDPEALPDWAGATWLKEP